MKDFAIYALEYMQSNPTSGISQETKMLLLSTQFIPRSFDWLLFIAGVGMHQTAILLIVIGKLKTQPNPQN
jgi:hypothetical protein